MVPVEAGIVPTQVSRTKATNIIVPFQANTEVDGWRGFGVVS